MLKKLLIGKKRNGVKNITSKRIKIAFSFNKFENFFKYKSKIRQIFKTNNEIKIMIVVLGLSITPEYSKLLNKIREYHK